MRNYYMNCVLHLCDFQGVLHKWLRRCYFSQQNTVALFFNLSLVELAERAFTSFSYTLLYILFVCLVM